MEMCKTLLGFAHFHRHRRHEPKQQNRTLHLLQKPDISICYRQNSGPLCRKHMMCPVVVANEMSGLKGRVGVGSHPHWRLKVDAVISGPSFGAGNEDQRSHYKGDQWKD